MFCNCHPSLKSEQTANGPNRMTDPLLQIICSLPNILLKSNSPNKCSLQLYTFFDVCVVTWKPLRKFLDDCALHNTQLENILNFTGFNAIWHELVKFFTILNEHVYSTYASWLGHETVTTWSTCYDLIS